jgi:hypothetical protein
MPNVIHFFHLLIRSKTLRSRWFQPGMTPFLKTYSPGLFGSEGRYPQSTIGESSRGYDDERLPMESQ